MQEAVATASDVLPFFWLFLSFPQPLFLVFQLNLKPGSLIHWEVLWKQRFCGHPFLVWVGQCKPGLTQTVGKKRSGWGALQHSTALRRVFSKGRNLQEAFFNVPLCYMRRKCFWHSLTTLSPPACFITSHKSRNPLNFWLGWKGILWHSGILSKKINSGGEIKKTAQP